MDANDISIDVQTQYLEDRFPETEEKYAFAYKITITNNSKDEVTLRNRYWLITDGNGDKSEVAGKGVVGEQPLIKPGESYQYTSGAILDTPVGTMQGHYEFKCAENDELLKVPIKVFRLADSNVLN
ncbi:Co2+/Mg2+ efflux protein ApaG [Aliiglaciecola sp. 3_MG-2023]|uniref:Co2+/Mg2+ efflux protein ApaG n=1 Tax=Aliiglaciecola sp. 3_MG-2023 TaxID=3062644 RepID=UPI0026E33C8C|nr:Co2+/Mg2+ efflux protein ApaG [Aliiglaciecola sp. 3_MG-2023]MDO6695033.1 Co2+/Mg2+ efflux protein ApaG [Aliiglaciecola sp. 3_MG-2023]